MTQRINSGLFVLLMLFISSCSSPDVQTIINKTIQNHGGSGYENSRIQFTFRGTQYSAEHKDGRFTYTREVGDSAGVISDRLTNEGFTRTVNGTEVELTDSEKSAYANSLNSVIYFALLPYKLNDAAVKKEYLGQTSIQNEPYYEVQVTFRKEGGGKDHEDTFMYWIHRNNYTLDYLAYKFNVNGGGTRFREANNIRMIKGIRFADYNNFKSMDEEAALWGYDKLFEKDSLDKISEINLTDIKVILLQ